MSDKATPITIHPDPLEPYAIAPAWRVGDLVFLSGQAAIAEDGSIVGPGDFDAQLAQTFANIERVLAAAGSDMSKIVKVTIYLTDMALSPRDGCAPATYPKQTVNVNPMYPQST
ncbi:MAG: RidA family protein, partial [Pseudomonadota bacterium]